MRRLGVLALLVLTGCDSDAPTAPAPIPDPTPAPDPDPTPAPDPDPTPAPDPDPMPDPDCDAPTRYRVVFTTSWDGSTHGDRPPFPASAHFSRVAGATHVEDLSYWSPEAIASDGIERMAETGGVGALCREVQAQADQDRSSPCVSGPTASFPSPGSSTFMLDAEARFPVVTLVSMIAPSPDWFVGVHGEPLMEDGCWRDAITVNLTGYDSGTDRGSTFVAPDADVTPHDPIGPILALPVAVRDIPFATLTLTRQ